jgi:hypothetical protein
MQQGPPLALLHEDWDYCIDGAAWADLTRARSHPPIYQQFKKQAEEQGRCTQSRGEEWVEVWPPNIMGFGMMGGIVIVFAADRALMGGTATYWWVHRNALHVHDADGEAVPFVP